MATSEAREGAERRAKITTRAGDGGETWVGKRRLPKDHPVVELVGELDELQSCVGVALWQCRELSAKLERVVEELHRIMAGVHQGEAWRGAEWMEEEIAEGMEEVEGKAALSGFVVPKGRGSVLHLCRAVARRAERAAVRAVREGAAVDLPTLNRLSDLLFVYGLLCSLSEGFLYTGGGRRGSR